MADLHWNGTDYEGECPECQKPIIVDFERSTDCGTHEWAPDGGKCAFCDRYVHLLCLPEITTSECCTACAQKYFSADGKRIA